MTDEDADLQIFRAMPGNPIDGGRGEGKVEGKGPTEVGKPAIVGYNISLQSATDARHCLIVIM